MDQKIVIIGAGVSGIGAGVKLIENGFTSVVILEAENRLGGRIKTIPFGENFIELGAQWCHGQTNNAVYELAGDKNVFESDAAMFARMRFYQSDGNIVPEDVKTRMSNLNEKVMALVEDGEVKGSLGDFYVQKFNEELEKPEYADIDASTRAQFLRSFDGLQNALEASDSWYDIWTEKGKDYDESGGDFSLNWKDNGYKTLFDILTKKFDNNQNYIHIEEYVKLGKEVSEIAYNLEPKSEAPSHPILVKCADGSSYEADHVICSVSLGVLKERHQALFNPSLPKAKIDSIEGIGFGTVGKIFMEFDRPFWPENWEGFIALWNEDDLKALREQPGNEWLEYVAAIYPLNRQKNILLCWVNGAGQRQQEELSESEVSAGIVLMMKKFLKDWTVPTPLRIQRSQWNVNPHFRGSYSYYHVKGEAVNASRHNLAEPVADTTGKPVIQFCGEATNETQWSTVHGALTTGWREADRIINLYK